MRSKQAIQAARKAIKLAGGYVQVSEKLKERKFVVCPEAVRKWNLRGVPGMYAITLEELSSVSRSKLAPELYPE